MKTENLQSLKTIWTGENGNIFNYWRQMTFEKQDLHERMDEITYLMLKTKKMR